MAKAMRALQKTSKYAYLFGNGKADGDGSMKALLGGKGANLAEMSRIGLPVPPGFTITTEVCTYYYAHKKTYPKELQALIKSGIAHIEKIMGTKFGDKKNMPLLVSVRSGAREQSRWGPLDREIPFALKTGLIHPAAAAVRDIRNKARQIVHRYAVAVDYLLRDSVRRGSLGLPLAIRAGRGVRSRLHVGLAAARGKYEPRQLLRILVDFETEPLRQERLQH